MSKPQPDRNGGHPLRDRCETMLYATGGQYLHIPRSVLDGPERPVCTVDHSGMRAVPPAAVPSTHAVVCPRCAERLTVLEAAPDYVPPVAAVTSARETHRGNPATTMPGRVLTWLDEFETVSFWRVSDERLRVVSAGDEPDAVSVAGRRETDPGRNEALRRQVQSRAGNDTKAPKALLAQIGVDAGDMLAWWPVESGTAVDLEVVVNAE